MLNEIITTHLHLISVVLFTKLSLLAILGIIQLLANYYVVCNCDILASLQCKRGIQSVICYAFFSFNYSKTFNCSSLISSYTIIVPSFTTISDVDKFMFLLTSHDLDICKVVILGLSNMYLVNQSMKPNL
jgi:hypothetical protein